MQFIRPAKELGFTLAEIKEILGLWFDAKTRCEHVRQRAEQKITDIEDKIRSLQKLKRSLKKVISEGEVRDSIGDCPLLEGIDNGDRPANPNLHTR